jgi:hypothetical protein
LPYKIYGIQFYTACLSNSNDKEHAMPVDQMPNQCSCIACKIGWFQNLKHRRTQIRKLLNRLEKPDAFTICSCQRCRVVSAGQTSVGDERINPSTSWVREHAIDGSCLSVSGFGCVWKRRLEERNEPLKWCLLKVTHDGAIADVPQAIQCASSSPSVRKKNICHLLVVLCLDLFVVTEALVLLLGAS